MKERNQAHEHFNVNLQLLTIQEEADVLSTAPGSGAGAWPELIATPHEKRRICGVDVGEMGLDEGNTDRRA